eukprot:gene2766-biopygen2689
MAILKCRRMADCGTGVPQDGDAEVALDGDAEVAQDGDVEVSQDGDTEVAQDGDAEVSQDCGTEVSQDGDAEVAQYGDAEVAQDGDVEVAQDGDAEVSQDGDAVQNGVSNPESGDGIQNGATIRNGDTLQNGDTIRNGDTVQDQATATRAVSQGSITMAMPYTIQLSIATRAVSQGSIASAALHPARPADIAAGGASETRPRREAGVCGPPKRPAGTLVPHDFFVYESRPGDAASRASYARSYAGAGSAAGSGFRGGSCGGGCDGPVGCVGWVGWAAWGVGSGFLPPLQNALKRRKRHRRPQIAITAMIAMHAACDCSKQELSSSSSVEDGRVNDAYAALTTHF